MNPESFNPRFLQIPARALWTSIYLHIALFVVVLCISLLNYLGISVFSHKIEPKQNPYQNYIQVDIVDLPDQLVNETIDTSLPEVPTPKVEKKIGTVPPPAVDKKIGEVAIPKEESKTETPDLELKEKEIEKPDASGPKIKPKEEKKAPTNETTKSEDKIRRAQDTALKSLREEARREAALKGLAARSGTPGRTKIKGNILSEGTASQGAIGTAKDRYLGLVTQAIERHFRYFNWYKKRDLKASIYIEIYPTGMLRKRTWVSQSTDPAFDQAAIDAIDAALPLPLPRDLSILSEGFSITFVPKE